MKDVSSDYLIVGKKEVRNDIVKRTFLYIEIEREREIC